MIIGKFLEFIQRIVKNSKEDFFNVVHGCYKILLVKYKDSFNFQRTLRMLERLTYSFNFSPLAPALKLFKNKSKTPLINCAFSIS